MVFLIIVYELSVSALGNAGFFGTLAKLTQAHNKIQSGVYGLLPPDARAVPDVDLATQARGGSTAQKPCATSIPAPNFTP